MKAILTYLALGVSAYAQQAPSPTTPPTPPPTKPAAVGAATAAAAPDLQKLRPNAAPYRIERVSYGTNASFKKVEIFWVPPAPAPAAKPKAFLVLATDMARARTPLEDKAWVDFAQKQGLGIMSVGIEELEQTSRLLECATELGNRIYKVADEKFGPGLKGAVVSSGLGGTWMHRVMMRQPWRWGFWSSRGVAKYPIPPRAIEYPAGVLFCTDAAHYESNLFFFQDLRRTKNTNKVGFLSLDGKAVDQAYVDRMTQNYMLAVFGGGMGQSRWYDLNTEVDLTNVEKKPSAIVQSWVPGDEVPGAWKLMHQEKKRAPDCTVANATISVPELAKDLTVFFRIPGKVKEGVGVRSVLICFQWEQSDDDLYNKLRSSTEFHSTLWERERLGVIALNMHSLGFTQDLKPEDIKRLEQVVKLVAAPFWKAVGDASTELGWPRTGLNIFGARSGAEFAEALVQLDTTPSKFATVHLHCGTVFSEPKPELRNIAWLVSTGGKHEGFTASTTFYQNLKKKGWPAMYKMSTGNYGNTDYWTHLVGVQLCGSIKTWTDAIKKDVTEGRKPQAVDAAAMLIGQMNNPVVWMNTTDGRIFLAKDAEKVPAEVRMGIPTLDMEEAWRLSGAPLPPAATTPPSGPVPAPAPDGAKPSVPQGTPPKPVASASSSPAAVPKSGGASGTPATPAKP
ncbi:hypothetical protein [Roseimicrobium sp. ORNL1]|uniref:hypothetical protein n=1 Tax=Roseimicrobium sp. ORNL1 TaxID=2711231 RepID=UPI0013E10776|nr:hypothetical protein [Roseimicrobium sp. ORNL1]QIF02449.1 hypothetical protein G5S37_13245 [Roseimicrobium sp. ORNL1]